MTDANRASVESGSSGTSGNTSGTNPDIIGGAPPASASPNSRWRFDFDFNFDPAWLVSAGANHQPLSIINDWVRTRIPVSVGGSQTAGPGQPGNAIAAGPLNTSEVLQGTLPSHQGAMNSSVGTGGSLSRNRNSPLLQRGQTETGAEGNSAGTITSNPGSGRDSQSYVVQIQPDENVEWDQNEAPENTAEEQEAEPAADTTERTAADIIRQNPEAQAFFNIIERYAPFVLLLFIKGLFDHGSGIICFLALLVTFSHANSLLKKEVSKQSKRNLLCLLMITVNLLVCIAFMFYVFEDQRLYATLLFMPTNLSLSSIWTLFWLISVTDFVAKFVTVIMKAVVLSLPQGVTPFQKRGKYYLFIEQSSQLYRCLLPLYPWLCFFIEYYEGPIKVFGFLLSGLYCLFKAGDLVKRMRAWRISVGKLLQQVHYGTSPTAEDLTNAGAQCPICHDVYMYPTRLSCSHIFCEECVSTWFDRERTCPMCRAKVVDDPAYRDGSTTHFIQIF